MSKVFLSLAVITAIFSTLASQSTAGLITVQFDGFTTPNGTPQTVFTSGALSVQRTATLGDNTQYSGTHFSTAAVVPFNTFTLTYNVVGGNFGDVFATSGSSGAAFDGFAVSVVYSFGGQGRVSINGGATQSLGPGANVFRNVANPLDTSVSFSFTHEPGGSGSMTVTSLSAVPEPTALMLVGSVVGLCFIRRRRF